MAIAELRHFRVDWITADPLSHLSSPYICFRRSAARSRMLPADAVIRLLCRPYPFASSRCASSMA